ncbi:MAG: hypothetical protein R3Y36_02915 [Spirochaetales bacterium]
MNLGQKIAITLPVSVLIFAIFALFAFSNLFAFIEIHSYQPALLRNIEYELSYISQSFTSYINATQEYLYVNFVDNAPVKEYISSSKESENLIALKNAAEDFQAYMPAVTGMRFIEKNGETVYTTYNETAFAGAEIKNPNHKNAYIGLNPDIESILYDFPLYNIDDTYYGNIIFYIDISEFEKILLRNNILHVADSLYTVGTAEHAFLVSGFPTAQKNVFIEHIQSFDTDIRTGMYRLSTEPGLPTHILFFAESIPGIYIGRVYNEDFFVFSTTQKILLSLCIFIGVYLLIFLLLSLKQNDLDKNNIFEDIKKREAEYNDLMQKDIDVHSPYNNTLTAEIKRVVEEILGHEQKSAFENLSATSDKIRHDNIHNQGNMYNISEGGLIIDNQKLGGTFVDRFFARKQALNHINTGSSEKTYPENEHTQKMRESSSEYVQTSIKNDSIIEKAGLYIIPGDLNTKIENLDTDFKILVDSVLRDL